MIPRAWLDVFAICALAAVSSAPRQADVVQSFRISRDVARRLKTMNTLERTRSEVILANTIELRYRASQRERARCTAARIFPGIRHGIGVTSIRPFVARGGHVMTEVVASLAWNLLPLDDADQDRELTSTRQQRVDLSVILPVLSLEEVQQLVSLLPPNFDLDRGDLEMIPKRWIMIERGGVVQNEHRELAAKMRLILENRILPFIRNRMSCPRCLVCSSIVRRYHSDVVGERYRDPPHTDGQAFATVVIALNSANDDYIGGLYVITDPSTPHFVALRAGEAIVHSWDLQHGVEVTQGQRLSWIIWVQDSQPCVKQPEFHQREFFKSAAQAGNVVAMHILGSATESSASSRAWLQRAAEAGFPRAMGQLGASLQITNKAGAKKWLEGASMRGDITAQAELGMLYLRLGAFDDAEGWLRKAAESGHAIAQHDFGMALYTGALGQPRDLANATTWLKAAARQGHAQAQANLGTCYAEGSGVPRRDTAAFYWWQEAATQGVVEAMRNLEELKRKNPGWQKWLLSAGD